MEQEVKQFLSDGKHYSALKHCLTACESATGITRQQIRTVLDILTDNDEILTSADDELRSRYKQVAGKELGYPVPDNFVGKAAFPVFNEAGSSMVMLEAKENHPEGVIGFSATDEANGKLFDCLKILWQFLQKNLRASDLLKNDVTVTNWGLRFSTYANPEHTGRLATENRLIIDGGSFQFAAFIASVSKVTGIPVDPGYIFTGSFDSSEKMAGVTGIPEKVALVRKERPGFKKIVIPNRNYFSNSDKKFIIQNEGIFLEVNSIEELVEKVFEVPVNKLFVFDTAVRHRLGVCRIIAKNLGIREIELYDKLDDRVFNRKKYSFNVVHCSLKRPNVNIKFNVFPIPEIAFSIDDVPGTDILVVFDYPNANVYLGNYISNNTQTAYVYSIGIGQDGLEAQIFANRKGNSDKYIGKFYQKSQLGLPES